MTRKTDKETRMDYIEDFLDELYEAGTGSHNTIEGIKVRLSSWWDAEFEINGKYYEWDEAIEYLERSI